jgi:two-component system, chemotaxis family, sensor kinase Cph1
VLDRTRDLEAANVELQQSNRDLDDFAYIASHDLKEPLRGIHNYSMFLLEDYGDKLDEEGRAKLETLMRLTRRMEVLIDSLLQFSRLGRVDLAMDDVDLNETVAEVLDSLGINLQAERVEVVIPHPLPIVRCDRVRVGEIFHNLIVNAVKYNEQERKRVEIGWIDGEPPVFYVRDNGIGIQEKHFESIFRIFKRLHAREKFGGGTGAGLTIVKKIVERHNGRIWVESTPGAGTTFYFTLAKGDTLAEHTQTADPPGRGQP